MFHRPSTEGHMTSEDVLSYDHLLQQLKRIEDEMQNQGLWAVEPPSPEALASLAPFCYDTLFFHEWLQWVFIPKMTELLRAGAVPPQPCDISPLAEHSFQDLPQDTDQLLRLIETFDALTVDFFPGQNDNKKRT